MLYDIYHQNNHLPSSTKEIKASKMLQNILPNKELELLNAEQQSIMFLKLNV